MLLSRAARARPRPAAAPLPPLPPPRRRARGGRGGGRCPPAPLRRADTTVACACPPAHGSDQAPAAAAAVAALLLLAPLTPAQAPAEALPAPPCAAVGPPLTGVVCPPSLPSPALTAVAHQQTAALLGLPGPPPAPPSPLPMPPLPLPSPGPPPPAPPSPPPPPSPLPPPLSPSPPPPSLPSPLPPPPPAEPPRLLPPCPGDQGPPSLIPNAPPDVLQGGVRPAGHGQEGAAGRRNEGAAASRQVPPDRSLGIPSPPWSLLGRFRQQQQWQELWSHALVWGAFTEGGSSPLGALEPPALPLPGDAMPAPLGSSEGLPSAAAGAGRWSMLPALATEGDAEQAAEAGGGQRGPPPAEPLQLPDRPGGPRPDQAPASSAAGVGGERALGGNGGGAPTEAALPARPQRATTADGDALRDFSAAALRLAAAVARLLELLLQAALQLATLIARLAVRLLVWLVERAGQAAAQRVHDAREQGVARMDAARAQDGRRAPARRTGDGGGGGGGAAATAPAPQEENAASWRGAAGQCWGCAAG